MSTKTIKGQAWLEGDALMQEQILIVSGSQDSSYNTVALIEDVWEDLMSDDGTYKCNGKKDYFYWEVEMTDSENEDNTITVKFECPKPKEELFIDEDTGELIDEGDIEGDYAEYWYAKIKQAKENFEKSATIQREEVTFPGTQYVGQDGTTITLDDYEYRNNDFGDISNLLNLF